MRVTIRKGHFTFEVVTGNADVDPLTINSTYSGKGNPTDAYNSIERIRQEAGKAYDAFLASDVEHTAKRKRHHEL